MFSFINNNGDNNNDNKEPIREFYKNIYPNTSIYEIQQYVLELNNVFLYNHPNIQYEFIFKEPSKLSFFGLFGGGIGVNNGGGGDNDKSYIETLIMGTPDIKNKTTEPYVFFEDVLNKIFRIKNIPEEEKEQIAKETSIFYEKTTAPNESVGDWFKRIFYAPEPVPKPATITTPTSPPSSIFDVKPVVVLPPVPSIPLITEPTPATTTPTPTKITSIFGDIEPVVVGVGGPSKKEEEDIKMDASGTMFDITPISIPTKPTTEQPITEIEQQTQHTQIEQIKPTPEQKNRDITTQQPETEIEEIEDIEEIEPTPEQTEQTEQQQELPYVLPEIPKKINKIIIQIYGEDTDKEEIEEIMKELYRVPIPFDDNTDNRDIYNTYSNKKIEIEKEMIGGVEDELNIENIRGTKLYYALLRKHKKGKIVYV